MTIQYDSDRLRERAKYATYTVAVDRDELLAVLDDLVHYRHILERIVGWDYPCRDDDCGAGDVAAKAFEER